MKKSELKNGMLVKIKGDNSIYEVKGSDLYNSKGRIISLLYFDKDLKGLKPYGDIDKVFEQV